MFDDSTSKGVEGSGYFLGEGSKGTLEAGTIAKDFDSAAAQCGDVLQRHHAWGRCRSKCAREGNENSSRSWTLMTPTLRRHGNTQEPKSLKILPQSFWAKHEKVKA